MRGTVKYYSVQSSNKSDYTSKYFTLCNHLLAANQRVEKRAKNQCGETSTY